MTSSFGYPLFYLLQILCHGSVVAILLMTSFLFLPDDTRTIWCHGDKSIYTKDLMFGDSFNNVATIPTLYCESSTCCTIDC